MKYIDADKLLTIIEERKAQQDQWINRYHDPINQGISHELTEILSIIDSLQQEQPEVDLDFQVFAKEMDAVFNLPKEVAENTEENPLNWEYAIARHFYELGLNARKEETK